MSTPAAAVETAAPTLVDPGAVADAGDGGAPDNATAVDFGTIGEVREALGLPIEDEPGDAKTAPAKDDKKPEAKAETKKEETEEDPDAAAILAINRRSAAHRRARLEAQKAAQAKATPAVEAPKPAE